MHSNIPRIAIVGSGVSGLAVAHYLQDRAAITLFEANDYFGGHTHTVDITLPTPQGPVQHGVDTGFLVFNERTYPHLISFFADLKVKTAPSEMSFSVKIPATATQAGLEWSGSSLNSLFTQRSNLLRWKFLRMLFEIARFNRVTTKLAKHGSEQALSQSLGEFLRANHFSKEFKNWYFLPMTACIWSCPTEQMLQFPVATLVRFCHNHGLLQIRNRPQWWTVAGGARHYVDKVVATIQDKRLKTPVQRIERQATGVLVTSLRHGKPHVEHFDKVVLATHADQSLALLARPSAAEQAVLGAIGYQSNLAVLHTDASVLPRKKAAWAAWNYESAHQDQLRQSDQTQVCLHYLLNKLQPLPFSQPVVVSLNPINTIAPELVLGTFAYAHPVFDAAAIAAQEKLPLLQGQEHTYFCGAWTGYGFHEDGFKSGLHVAQSLLDNMPLQLADAPLFEVAA